MLARPSLPLALFVLFGAVFAFGYDVNKDLRNIGTAAAHDLTVVLSGSENVTNHYDGYPSRRFQSFATGPVPPNTQLRWQDLNEPGGNNMIDPGEIVHVGWTTADHSSNVKDMWWTDATGARIPGSKIYNITSGWTYETNSQLVTLSWFNEFDPANDDPATISVLDLHFAVLDTPVPLEELNFENGPLNDQMIFVDSFFDVEYNAPPLETTLPVSVGPDQAVVLRYGVTGPGSSAEATDFVQFVVPEPASLAGFGIGALLLGASRLRRG